MANPILNSCCRCQSLRTGSIIAGVCAILLSIVAIVVMLTVPLTYRTIFLDWLPPWIVKIIIAFNLGMTILISIIMIVGAVKVSDKLYYILSIIRFSFRSILCLTHSHSDNIDHESILILCLFFFSSLLRCSSFIYRAHCVNPPCIPPTHDK